MCKLEFIIIIVSIIIFAILLDVLIMLKKYIFLYFCTIDSCASYFLNVSGHCESQSDIISWFGVFSSTSV